MPGPNAASSGTASQQQRRQSSAVSLRTMLADVRGRCGVGLGGVRGGREGERREDAAQSRPQDAQPQIEETKIWRWHSNPCKRGRLESARANQHLPSSHPTSTILLITVDIRVRVLMRETSSEYASKRVQVSQTQGQCRRRCSSRDTRFAWSRSHQGGGAPGCRSKALKSVFERSVMYATRSATMIHTHDLTANLHRVIPILPAHDAARKRRGRWSSQESG